MLNRIYRKRWTVHRKINRIVQKGSRTRINTPFRKCKIYYTSIGHFVVKYWMNHIYVVSRVLHVHVSDVGSVKVSSVFKFRLRYAVVWLRFVLCNWMNTKTNCSKKCNRNYAWSDFQEFTFFYFHRFLLKNSHFLSLGGCVWWKQGILQVFND